MPYRPIRASGAAALLLLAVQAFAQQAGPGLAVDAAANLHPISPDIYGINFYWTLGTNPSAQATSAARDVRATLRRWGGNNTSTYHWKYDVSNIDADWFFEVLPSSISAPAAAKLPDGSSFNQYADQVRTTGGKILATVP